MKFCTALAFQDPAHFLELAKTADECGWDWFAVSDHVVYPETIASPYPYSPDGKPYWAPDTPWPDPWTAIAAMAAVTTRLRFFTNVFVLPVRQPVLVAKQVATVSAMSAGRVALGIGVGWMKEEFELVREDFHTRGKRTDECVAILRALWQGGMQEFHGRHYDFPPMQMSPLPPSPVPVFVGGASEAALKRAARIGDGWIAVQHTTDELRDLIGRIEGLRKDYGTDGRPFEHVVACVDAFDVDGYRRLEEIGATTLITAPWVLYGADPNSLEEKKDAIRRFADDVISHFHG